MQSIYKAECSVEVTPSINGQEEIVTIFEHRRSEHHSYFNTGINLTISEFIRTLNT